MSAYQFYCLDCTWSNVRSHQLRICENCGSRNLVRESALLAFYKNNDTSSMRVEIEMLKAEIARLQAHIAELETEMNSIKHAAHMPNDYQYNLPTWINCRLYVCYIGAEISPYLQELIESGKLRFPDSPAEKENIRLHARIATLERIIEREAEKTMKAGMPGEQHD